MQTLLCGKGIIFHYAGNNPIKYVDPDGEAIWKAVAFIGIAATMRSSSSSPPNPVDRTATLSQMSNISNLYDDGNRARATISDARVRSRERPDNVLLDRNPLLAVSHAMPRGMPNDFSDGIESPLGLSGHMLENITDGQGNMLGDVRLNSITDRGRLTRWSMTRTEYNPFAGGWNNRIFSREEAFEFLQDNKERFSETQFNEIRNQLRLD